MQLMLIRLNLPYLCWLQWEISLALGYVSSIFQRCRHHFLNQSINWFWLPFRYLFSVSVDILFVAVYSFYINFRFCYKYSKK